MAEDEGTEEVLVVADEADEEFPKRRGGGHGGPR